MVAVGYCNVKGTDGQLVELICWETAQYLEMQSAEVRYAAAEWMT